MEHEQLENTEMKQKLFDIADMLGEIPDDKLIRSAFRGIRKQHYGERDFNEGLNIMERLLFARDDGSRFDRSGKWDNILDTWLKENPETRTNIVCDIILALYQNFLRRRISSGSRERPQLK